ncbi:threonine synthase [Candidatus Peregrinibacteria bacterium]|jgi:threonine synthase|nr:threonine synthase [Candidatus Peregrinibacteria bacterium]MBT7703173.1 threonine synthase [Candidatus Peregrinibacteria bacterium]
MKKAYKLKCFLCEKEHDEQESATTCTSCHGPLETYYNYDLIAQKLNTYALKTAPISALKYMALYPIDDFKNIVSLEEGGTPLIHAKNLGKKLGLNNLYIKNEGMNPTGCFKDRGTMVEITKAKEMGAKAICVASTGNMAASVSAYSAAAGIPCYVLVPEGTPLGKLSQTLTFGARLIQVRASYSTCAELAEQMAQRFGYYLAGDYTFRTEGQKSEGYEIIEQLFWRCPDYVVCPIGCGTNLHAIFKGIQELEKLGFIRRLPKLIGVQTEGCNPVVKAFEAGRLDFDSIKNPRTVASAIAAGTPLDGAKILKDVYDSEGTVVEVDDEYLLECQQEQTRAEGVFSEPSGALAYAAVKKLSGEGFFNEDDVVVCMATGNGLKDPKSPLKILPEPASVEPDFKEIERFIEQKLYAVRESGRIEKTKVLFTKSPKDSKAISKVLADEFDISVNGGISEAIYRSVTGFLEKGKEITKADLQYILEEILDEFSLKNRVLAISDFKVQTTMHDQAEAEVWAEAFGKEVHAYGKGVGPVDAAIQALKDALKVKVWLIDYEVAIDASGVDAAVEVKMTLKNEKGHRVVARSTSPDIIVASLKAFEKGVNILYSKLEGI